MFRETLAAGFLVSIFAVPSMTALLVAQHLRPWETPTRNKIAAVGCWSLAGLLSFAFTGQNFAIASAALGIALTFMSRRFLKAYYVSGAILLSIAILNVLLGGAWAVNFICMLPASLLTRALLLSNGALLILSLPAGLLTILPYQAHLFRKRWHRPRQPLPPNSLTSYPKVAFHVPCYAEPPEVVCETLNALSRMKYPNFEVLVIDNNTKDPNLWKPLEQHCLNLGPRFRFFHVDPLSGAKAGALNFALRHTSEDVELISCIDADYVAEPDFLDRLVGFFEDPQIGFVQTPHNYRNWTGNLYQRACYWEYTPGHRLVISNLNEWVSSYIVGTMCLIRKKALVEAGGWDEKCLTEDSECSIRIHALGYTSLFLPHTFGRGLIPENFLGYKKQRFRWTVGPIQQLKKHWRLFLPKPFGKPSKLSAWQRLFELSHSLQEVSNLIALLFTPLSIAALFSIIIHQEKIIIPTVLWISIAMTIPSGMAMRWLSFRMLGCRSLMEMFGGTVASLSLTHVCFIASLTGWFSLKSPKWQRTSKFKVLPNKFRALGSASVELLLAFLFTIAAVLVALEASFTPPDILAMTAFGLFTTALSYLAAPIMAVLADFQLRSTDMPAIPSSLSQSTLKVHSSVRR